VKVTTNEDLVQYLALENKGGVLHLGYRPNVRISNTVSKAEVQMPSIKQISFSGATAVELIGEWAVPVLRVDLSGASSLIGRMISSTLRELCGCYVFFSLWE
jgi:hypothetical protein